MIMMNVMRESKETYTISAEQSSVSRLHERKQENDSLRILVNDLYQDAGTDPIDQSRHEVGSLLFFGGVDEADGAECGKFVVLLWSLSTGIVSGSSPGFVWVSTVFCGGFSDPAPSACPSFGCCAISGSFDCRFLSLRRRYSRIRR